MNVQKRMSPFTAFFLGVFGVIAVGIVSGSALTFCALNIVDHKAASILGLAEGTIEGLPALIKALPPAVDDLLNDKRVPSYASQITIDAVISDDERLGSPRPVLTITNNGDEVVSMLAVRVAALNSDGVAIRDWTQVVATPIAIEGDWRGPLYPHSTRHVVVSNWHHGKTLGDVSQLTTAAEISELRVWQPSNNVEAVRTASIVD